ncbi:hypothetical protein MN116_003435 [Schistosoma mekongi]|uniref:Malectin domain-containing protein n=1 Tax=Schistosoma mekongi TaxID=38744 RepID=A0AAE2D7N0_SCHME|nr:hypothetical protein MN116_003435 [Schistosoma mekongi]
MFVIFIFLIVFPDYNHGEVVWAVNCGGPKHTDSHGIKYIADFLNIGTASDYGRSFDISRVVPEDYILYQTERYHNDDFSYPIPVTSDGEYILTLKFSEVWFTERYQKVFDVHIQNTIPIIENLDIFDQVGFATALDFHLQFKIKDRVLFIRDTTATIDADIFTVDFIKTQFDNPKINAIVVTKGTIKDVPQLPPLEVHAHEEQTFRPQSLADPDEEDDQEAIYQRISRTPKANNPYAYVDSSYLILPILISIGAFLPILFCLCKL